VSNLEAMAHGLPVICSDTNGTACYTRPGLDGFLFRDNDEESLVDVLDGALTNRERLAIMGRNAQASARENYSGRAYVSRLEALISQLTPGQAT
jgi:glycosyltransferase involved in cell wall biosynthesis